MLVFCDPGDTATADITAFTRGGTVARYSGTVAELFADFNAGTPERHRPGRGGPWCSGASARVRLSAARRGSLTFSVPGRSALPTRRNFRASVPPAGQGTTRR